MSHNAKELPDKTILDERYTYDPESGEVTSKKTGAPLRRKDISGYNIVTINSKIRKLHRVIWKMMTGEEPDGMIDHIDGDPANNKWENLRCVSAAEFAAHKVVKESKVGIDQEMLGVSFYKRTKTWRVQLKIDGKSYAKYGFKTAEEASAHAKEMRDKMIYEMEHKEELEAERIARENLLNDIFGE